MDYEPTPHTIPEEQRASPLFPPSGQSPIHYLLNTLSFNIMQLQQLTAWLNKS
jgi:hypothetical protein